MDFGSRTKFITFVCNFIVFVLNKINFYNSCKQNCPLVLVEIHNFHKLLKTFETFKKTKNFQEIPLAPF